MLRLTRRLPGAAAAARCGSGGAIRRFGVMAVPTPNPAARQYWPCSGETVLDSPGPALEYRSRAAAQESELASRLLTLDRAVSAVTLAESFVTVSINLGRTSWDDELPGGGEAITVGDAVEQCIGQFLDASLPIVSAAVRARRHAAAAQSTADEHPTVSQIKEVLETHVRANIQADGGDVEFHDFDHDNGHLRLRLKGACVSCASSTVTVRFMIKNVLQHYVDGIEEVSAVDIEEDSQDDWIG